MVFKVSREVQVKKVKKVFVAPKDRKVMKAKRVKKDLVETGEMWEPMVPKAITVVQVSLAMWVQMAFPEKEAPSDQKVSNQKQTRTLGFGRQDAMTTATSTLQEQTKLFFNVFAVFFTSSFVIFLGQKGLSGTDGQDGRLGRKGEKGIKGFKGSSGEDGTQGEVGGQGEMGAEGDTGEKGEPGDPGIGGFDGIPGETGSRG